MSSYLILSLISIVVICMILLFSINEGGKKQIAKTIKERGDPAIVFLSFRIFTSKGFSEKAAGILTFSDLRLIKNRCPEVKEICIETSASFREMRIGNKQYRQEYFNNFPSISGIFPNWIKAANVKVKEGRFINNTDIIYKRRVCVLGGDVPRFIGKVVWLYQGKFPICVLDGATPQSKDLIGKKLVTKDLDGEFTIVGILHKKMPLFTALPEAITEGMTMIEIDESGHFKDKLDFESMLKKGWKSNASGVNEDIYIPFTTWQDFVKERDFSVISRGGITLKSRTLDGSLFSQSTLPPCSIRLLIDIPFEKKDKEEFIIDKKDLKVFGDFCPEFLSIPKILQGPIHNIRKVLKKRYGEDKFFKFEYYGTLIDELKDQIEDSNKLLRITFLSSLLFSCIILASMMLISVSKRTSEIGVRRAFGARKKDIFWQFLAEGVMLYSVGIVIGLFVGILVSYLVITKIAGWEFSIPIFGVIVSSIFVFVVGILSSLYPAMRAANIPPAIAVKYE